MRRLLVIVLLAMLPLQFSWAAVASYCAHEAQGAGHFGHHDHAHPDGASTGAGPSADAVADAAAVPDDTGGAESDQAAGAMDLDCGHCHGTCGVMLSLPLAVQGARSTAMPMAAPDEAGAAHAPTRPERPQWPPLA